MIYLVNREHRYTMRDYLAQPYAEDLSRRIRLFFYQDLRRTRSLPATTYIFSDHERFTAVQDDLVGSVWGQLAGAAPDIRLLNDPGKVLKRYELLRKLYETGRNVFRAVRATGNLDGLRYPVFVREENAHTGSLTDLLDTRGELNGALRKLTYGKYRRRNLLVVEFCDTSGGSGVFRKYSAFRVGDRIIPKYLTFKRQWVVKSHHPWLDVNKVREELEYLETNPHEEWLRETFDLARIDYGRIDYGLLDGRPQVWEINTNPTIGPQRSRYPRAPSGTPEEILNMRLPGKERFRAAFLSALRALDDCETQQEEIKISLSTPLAARLWTVEKTHWARDAVRSIPRRLGRHFRPGPQKDA